MPEIAIDPAAVESARFTMIMVRDTLNGLYSQYQSTAGEIERMLWDAAAEVLDALNPLHALDGFGVWDRWGFGGPAYAFSSTRDALEHARRMTDQAVERLCDAHRSQLAPLLNDRAAALRSALSAAHDSLWTMTSLLHPGAIRSLIQHPGSILEHAAHVRSLLHHACDEAQAFVDYLTRLNGREQALIEEITHSLPVTSPSLVGSLQGVPLTVQGAPGSQLQGGSSSLQGNGLYLAGEPPSSQISTDAKRAAANALDVIGWLKPGNDGFGHDGFNHLDWTRVPGGEDGELGKKLKAFFQTDPGDWLFDNDSSKPNVQCVAFVQLSYQLASGGKIVMPAVGDANQFWKAYANNAVRNWTEVTNAVGSDGWPPRIGDVMVSTAHDHVAIVTGVDLSSDGRSGTITIAQANAPLASETYSLTNGKINPDYGIDGFLRYTGPDIGG